jgi:hypothetical protein
VIFARNNVRISNENYGEERTYNLDSGLFANKLSVQLLAADRSGAFVFGPVVVQITEGEEHTYEDELNTEQFLELGFNSRSFITPITGARFRIPTLADGVAEVQDALLHFVFYG